MLKSVDVIIWGGEEVFEGADLGTRVRMLSKNFARLSTVNKVIVINQPWSYIGRLLARRRKRPLLEGNLKIVSKGRGYKIIEVSPKLFHVVFTELFPWSLKNLRGFIKKSYQKKAQHALQFFGTRDALLWLCDFRLIQAASIVPAKITVFNPVDNMLHHERKSRDKPEILAGYKWGEQHSDFICIASEHQKEMFSSDRRFFVIPQGVDDLFFENRIQVPARLVPYLEMDRPIVGYVGIMQDRFDIDLFETVVRSLPDFVFLMIGPVFNLEYFKPLEKYPNCIFLGKVDYHKIPEYLTHFSVSVIPHKINRLTASMNPCKLYEYMSSGRPIVSTPINGIEVFKEHIYIAKTAQEFISGLKEAVKEPAKKQEDRVAIAKQHSWLQRTKEIIDFLNENVS